jgi:hypothetical protein
MASDIIDVIAAFPADLAENPASMETAYMLLREAYQYSPAITPESVANGFRPTHQDENGVPVRTGGRATLRSGC